MTHMDKHGAINDAYPFGDASRMRGASTLGSRFAEDPVRRVVDVEVGSLYEEMAHVRRLAR